MIRYCIRRRSRVVVMSLAAAVILLGTVMSSAPRARAALPSPLLLPFPIGQTWYICQGYNGQISHQRIPALDLSIDPNSQLTPNGCNPSTANASTGKQVTAPANGTAYRVNTDMVCINFDSGGGSALIGHVTSASRPASGTHVVALQGIGYLAPPGYGSNGGYAHIHIQAYSQPGCGSAPPVPFDDAHQARFQCAPDLHFNSDPTVTNQYGGVNGLYLSSCGIGSTSANTLVYFGVTVRGISVVGADNHNPLHPSRTLAVDFYNTSNQLVSSKTVGVSFSHTTGAFTGVLNLGTAWPVGLYQMRVRLPYQVDYTLRRTLLGTSFGSYYNLGPKKAVYTPQTPLISGDINGDNVLNILDYNLLLSCYGSNVCPPVYKAGSDLNDDGVVNGVDYNIFLYNIGHQAGN